MAFSELEIARYKKAFAAFREIRPEAGDSPHAGLGMPH